MPSNAQTPFENPLTILSEAGHRRFGELIRQLAREAAYTPLGRTFGRAVIIELDIEAFRERLMEVGMAEDVDYRVADGVQRVDLIPRRQYVATILLPDPAALDAAEGDSASVSLPRLVYERAQTDPTGDEDHVVISRAGMAGEREGKAGSDDPFDAFLNVHMSSYIVAQCL